MSGGKKGRARPGWNTPRRRTGARPEEKGNGESRDGEAATAKRALVRARAQGGAHEAHGTRVTRAYAKGGGGSRGSGAARATREARVRAQGTHAARDTRTVSGTSARTDTRAQMEGGGATNKQPPTCRKRREQGKRGERGQRMRRERTAVEAEHSTRTTHSARKRGREHMRGEDRMPRTCAAEWGASYVCASTRKVLQKHMREYLALRACAYKRKRVLT